MGQPEALAAWRLYRCNWLVLGVMAAALIAGMALTGFSFAPASMAAPFAIAGPYVAYSFYNYRLFTKFWHILTFSIKTTSVSIA